MLGVCIIDWMKTFMDFGLDTYLLFDELKSTLFRAVEIAALVSSGLWCGIMVSSGDHTSIHSKYVNGNERMRPIRVSSAGRSERRKAHTAIIAQDF